MKLLLGGITEISTIDYPGHTASVVYMCGCPYRCPFCQNSTLVDKKDCREIEVTEAVSRLRVNIPLITGVCITGGEPTVQMDGLIKMCKLLKKEGVKIKLDTNGYYPKRVNELIDMGLLDFVAVDIKAPFTPEKYVRAVGLEGVDGVRDGKELIKRVAATLEIIASSGIDFEPRTTVVPGLVYKKDDILAIANFLRDKGFDYYVLQQFRPENGCLEREYENYAAPPRDYLFDVGREVREIVPDVLIRTKENGEENVS